MTLLADVVTDVGNDVSKANRHSMTVCKAVPIGRLRSVRTYLKELETKGLLSIKQQGQGRPNLYYLDLQADLLISGKPFKPDRKIFPVKTGKKQQF